MHNSYNYYVYFLVNYKNTVIYVGVTNNLERRVYEHKNKLIKGFTAKYNVGKLVNFEIYNDVQEAILREKQIKANSREYKFKLIMKDNVMFKDLSNDF